MEVGSENCLVRPVSLRNNEFTGSAYPNMRISILRLVELCRFKQKGRPLFLVINAVGIDLCNIRMLGVMPRTGLLSRLHYRWVRYEETYQRQRRAMVDGI